MCGRFCNESEIPIDELKSIIDEVNRKIQKVNEAGQEQISMKVGEVFPTNIVPVLAPNKQHVATAYPMQWGFSKFDGKGQIINARSESALEKPMFRKPTLERRCLIPATNYYEWQTVGSRKVKHALRDPVNQMIYMAGIYRYEADKQLPTFVILTRDAAPGISYIHDRMPVILNQDARSAWISDSADITGIISSAISDLLADAV